MRKVMATVVACALAIGVAGFTMSAGASQQGTQTNWSQWHAQAVPLYNAVINNDHLVGGLNQNTSNAAWTSALTAEVGADVGLASLADSPSAVLNADITAYSRTDAQAAAYGLVCVNSNGATGCGPWGSLGKVAMKTDWVRLHNELHALGQI